MVHSSDSHNKADKLRNQWTDRYLFHNSKTRHKSARIQSSLAYIRDCSDRVASPQQLPEAAAGTPDGKISAQPHTIVKQICFHNGKVLFLSSFSLSMNAWCSMGLCGNFTHQIIDDSLNNDCNAVRLTVRRQLIFAGITELWLIYITRPKTPSILLFHHVLSPSYLHSTHNYTTSISTSTALCLNYNDFVMNKGCQFWHGTKQITLWGRSVF